MLMLREAVDAARQVQGAVGCVGHVAIAHLAESVVGTGLGGGVDGDDSRAQAVGQDGGDGVGAALAGDDDGAEFMPLADAGAFVAVAVEVGGAAGAAGGVVAKTIGGIGP